VGRLETTYVALLRGINVGGNNRLPMADLRAMMSELGLSDVKTVLQSGNAVFRTSMDPAELELLLEAETKKRFGFAPAYFVRTADEWASIVARNPFTEEGDRDPGHLLVICLRQPADPDQVIAVQQAVKGPERIHADGRQLYVVYPDGIGESKLATTRGWTKLGGVGTGRNWNTVLKLAAMVSD
jgi:uncharacterized protein (DUF1697 family)